MAFEAFQDGNEAVIRVSGAFDGEAAARVRAMLLAVPTSAAAAVTLDLTRVREITDIALATLVEAHGDRNVHLRILGLTVRHQRIWELLSRSARAPQSG